MKKVKEKKGQPRHPSLPKFDPFEWPSEMYVCPPHTHPCERAEVAGRGGVKKLDWWYSSGRMQSPSRKILIEIM